MGKLLIIGSTCVDVVLRMDHLPVTGEDLQPESQQFSIGGCGWNMFRAARITGADPVFLSPVGTGPYGQQVAEAFARANVPILRRVREENGCCYCLVEADGERTFLSVHGGEYTIHRAWLEALEESYDWISVCGMELQKDTGPEIIDWLETQRGTVFYAPGPRGILLDSDRQQRLLNLHPVLHLNEDEALALSGESTAESALETLWRRTGNLVVITLGPRGCAYRAKDGTQGVLPGRKVTVTDTIGAGDTHAGVTLGCLSRNLELTQALTLANAAAAYTVTRSGADLPESLDVVL